MALAEQTVHERGGGGKDRAVLLVRVGRRNEEPASELIARNVGGAEPTAEKSRAMRFADPWQAHQQDERGLAVRRRRDRGDLGAELRRERIGSSRIRTRLRRRR
jgi:hypothetical protein